MTQEQFIDKACEVIDQFCEGLEPHRRNFTLEDFRKAMAVKESLTTELKKKMIIEWDDKGSVDISVPEGEAKTVEVVGILEMCKLVLFENRQQKED